MDINSPIICTRMKYVSEFKFLNGDDSHTYGIPKCEKTEFIITTGSFERIDEDSRILNNENYHSLDIFIGNCDSNCELYKENLKYAFPQYEAIVRQLLYDILVRLKFKYHSIYRSNKFKDFHDIYKILLGHDMDDLLDKYKYEYELFTGFEYDSIGSALYFNKYHEIGIHYQTHFGFEEYY